MTGTPKPYCWIIPGDDTARMDGFIDASLDRDGEFSKPLYDAATLAAVEAERDAAQRQIDILGEENGAVHRRNEALAARLKEAEEALAEGIDVLNNLSSSIQVHGNYSSESTLTFLGQAIAACEDAAAALRPTDDRREPGTGGGDE